MRKRREEERLTEELLTLFNFHKYLKNKFIIHYVKQDIYYILDEESRDIESLKRFFSSWVGNKYFEKIMYKLYEVDAGHMRDIKNNTSHPLQKYFKEHSDLGYNFYIDSDVLKESNLIANWGGGSGRTKSKSRKIKKILRKKSHKRKSSQKNGRTLKNKKRRKYSRNYKKTRKN